MWVLLAEDRSEGEGEVLTLITRLRKGRVRGPPGTLDLGTQMPTRVPLSFLTNSR